MSTQPDLSTYSFGTASFGGRRSTIAPKLPSLRSILNQDDGLDDLILPPLDSATSSDTAFTLPSPVPYQAYRTMGHNGMRGSLRRWSALDVSCDPSADRSLSRSDLRKFSLPFMTAESGITDSSSPGESAYIMPTLPPFPYGNQYLLGRSSNELAQPRSYRRPSAVLYPLEYSYDEQSNSSPTVSVPSDIPPAYQSSSGEEALSSVQQQPRAFNPFPGQQRRSSLAGRPRYNFSPSQVSRLEALYTASQYPTTERILETSGQTGLTEKQIRTWLCNRRRPSR